MSTIAHKLSANLFGVSCRPMSQTGCGQVTRRPIFEVAPSLRTHMKSCNIVCHASYTIVFDFANTYSPANTSIGERSCVCGTKCLANFIAKIRYGPNTDKGFTCKEYLIPQQYADFLEGKGLPSVQQKCLLCHRYWLVRAYSYKSTLGVCMHLLSLSRVLPNPHEVACCRVLSRVVACRTTFTSWCVHLFELTPPRLRAHIPCTDHVARVIFRLARTATSNFLGWPPHRASVIVFQTVLTTTKFVRMQTRCLISAVGYLRKMDTSRMPCSS